MIWIFFKLNIVLWREKMEKSKLLLYAITDRKLLRGRSLEASVDAALQGGVTILQLREKNIEKEEFIKEALEIKDICIKHRVPLIINDNVEVCLQADADGVHLGQSDGSITEARKILGDNKIIGATAHNVEEAVKAFNEGADYLGVGAAFGSKTKLDAKPIDVNEYKRICAAVDIPVVAIGGINEQNIQKLDGSGISGVAVISGIFGKTNIRQAAAGLFDISTDMFA